jgi:hypothetical protein
LDGRIGDNPAGQGERATPEASAASGAGAPGVIEEPPRQHSPRELTVVASW